MTTRPATTDLARLAATGIACGVIVIDVATASAGRPIPEWIKITPRGAATCRDGRSFTFDPEALAARFAADSTDVAVDLGHATVKDDSAPAHGWIKDVEARPDGLYGRPDWLPSGRTILTARTHRYVSPAFHHDEERRATWIHSVALVATPALGNMPAIASAGPHQEPSMKGIATLVGLQPDATETAILSAISAGFVPKAQHDETAAQLAATTAQLASTSTELTGLKQGVHDAEVERTFEEALKEKRMLPAQREHLKKMSATPEGLAGVKAMLAATAPNTFAGASVLESRQAETGAAASKTPAALAAEARKYAAENGVSFVDAMSIITKPKPTT